ncbi:WD repeat-containing protein 44 isoform X3 [Episyrphus balteatus]|uniref:WD repeat-containing protein 44 isoform X3 n=1 Tax=Episyrphus balteatus TaxID=286459 RepID=UPI0024865539|nr:WD repeat-containing protein 44 isoform X3 [Episyrphus balteatus]
MIKLETDSDSSEEFFDAEDSQTPNRLSSRKSPPETTNKNEEQFIFPEPAVKVNSDDESTPVGGGTPSTISPSTSLNARYTKQDVFVEPKPLGMNSSTEGVFTNRPTHPFRVIENDAISIQSMTSLGRVGRILAGSVDPSAISIDRESIQNSISSNSQQAQNPIPSLTASATNSQSTTPDTHTASSRSDTDTKSIVSGQVKEKRQVVMETQQPQTNKIILQEPDVIASTKLAHSKTTDSITSSGPIAPPRRKKKPRKISSSSSEQFNMNEGLRLPPADDDDDTISIKSVKDVQKLREDIVKAIENSWNENSSITTAASNSRPVTTTAAGGTINRISHSLGNSSTSVYSKPSPSNSAKSNSAPGRVRYFSKYFMKLSFHALPRNSSIDPSQGLNLYKATQGGYVVKPRDEASNKAEGPTQEEIDRIEKILMENLPRPKLAGTGSNSLGSATRYPSLIYRSSSEKERRKSAGDEDVLKQMNIYVRTRTDSGKQLTDFEILEQVPVKNLDTGENMPLSSVKPPPVPEGWNPLSLHILKLTSHLEVMQKESDEESVIGIPASSEVAPDEEECETEDGNRLKKKTAKIKRFFGSTMRKTVDKAKSLASEVSHARHKEDVADIEDVMNPEINIKIKASSTNKGPYEFTKLQHVQDLSGEHTGAVWCMKFSSCGRLLATAGQDKVLRIWVLKDAYPFFQDMRTKYNADQKSSPTPSQESLVSQHSAEEAIAMATAAEKCTGPFMPKAFCSYIGHTSDLLDVSWSKNYFILSSSMDKTVRLWHISRKECLCCFQHIDFVTAIAFHPRDDRYFLSGSLDGKLRLWNIPDKKVALWNEVDGQTKLITAANFCQNGQFAVVGSYDGRCIFYNTDQLKYHTQIHVRSTRGKNRIGRKISGIEPMPGEDKILVTSNDSRVRLYDLRDLNLSCKYKGYVNVSSQIKASFSHDGKYIVAGSENQCIYIWKTNHDYSKLSSVRRDRSDFWEGIKAHNATVNCAIFAPHPEAIIKPEPDEISYEKTQNNQPDPLVEQRKKGCGYVLVSADFNGAIKVFINKTKPKHSSLPYTAIAD